ncbi:MAG: hypothetical protein Phyf2KO_23230 [Phycisphaerales bacterium]
MESDAQNLISLFHRKWALPVLAEMARTRGSRVVVLKNRLGIHPAALRQTLDHLIELGYVVANPGYGHPLRPEYILTAKGQYAADACARIDASSKRLGIAELAGRKWFLPVLWTVAEQPLRFTEIAKRARPITDRALSHSLVQLEEARLIRPLPLEIRPPAYLYGLHRRAGTIAEALNDLAA